MRTQIDSVFRDLQPKAVWAHFAMLCSIPRPSKQEDRLVNALQDWCVGQGLHNEVDCAGNLIIRKPAARGCEHWPTVILQAHLDMVCQANDPNFDWQKASITPQLVNDWLVCEETTLGADNGIGVALILAALEESQRQHGPLEALLTVDEEAGMGGARGLQPGILKGTLMLNLDTESWGDFYVGCAGGIDVDIHRAGQATPLDPALRCREIEVHGLRGGHSGVDIHEGRANAIKLIVRALCELQGKWPLQLIDLRGGTARNALPRRATARFAVADEFLLDIERELAALEADLHRTFLGIDDGIKISVKECSSSAFAISPEEQGFWLKTLDAAPFGVWKMSEDIANAVETSNNLGIVNIDPAQGDCNFMIRSLVDEETYVLAERISSLFHAPGSTVEMAGHYPGWQPSASSALLQRCQHVFAKEFNAQSATRVIHAGLECGIIGGKYPGLDAISFGPSIQGAHAPGERVNVDSVAKAWRLLNAILASFGDSP